MQADSGKDLLPGSRWHLLAGPSHGEKELGVLCVFFDKDTSYVGVPSKRHTPNDRYLQGEFWAAHSVGSKTAASCVIQTHRKIV